MSSNSKGDEVQRRLENIRRERRTVSHPRDRRMRQLEKEERRVLRLARQRDRLKGEQHQKLVRLNWFREQCRELGYVGAPVPPEEVLLLTQLYVDRNVAEIESLRQERNPPQGRIRVLETLREAEQIAFRSTKGLEIPSLADGDDVEILVDIWDAAPETSVVVPTVRVSVSEKHRFDPAKLEALARRLKTADEVRDVTILPRGVQMLTPSASSKAGQKKAKSQRAMSTVKASVKKMADTAEEVQKRAKASQRRQQEARLKGKRSAALAAHRNRG